MAVLMVGLAVALAAPAAMAQQEQQHATLTGADLPEPLEFTAEEHPTQYADVERELAWLLSRRSDSPEPDPDTLGPEYELIWYRGERGYRFFLYPLAQGGPRVFRPAEQPDDRTVRAAWYFARLTLPDTLREWGVPMTGDPAGTGGGEQAEFEPAPPRSPLAFLDDWRETLLLTGGVAVALLAGLASLAYLVRR